MSGNTTNFEHILYKILNKFVKQNDYKDFSFEKYKEFVL